MTYEKMDVVYFTNLLIDVISCELAVAVDDDVYCFI